MKIIEKLRGQIVLSGSYVYLVDTWNIILHIPLQIFRPVAHLQFSTFSQSKEVIFVEINKVFN